jgi:hypothetical protein
MAIVKGRASRGADEADGAVPGFWRTIPGILTAIAAVLTAVTGLVVALSEAGLFNRVTPPADIVGSWRATVTYPWNLTVPERFVFQVDQGRLIGTATYLKTPRGIESGTVKGDRISFFVRAEEIAGDERRSYEVKYDGVVVAGGLHFTMQDTRGNVPIQFAAVRELK